MWIDEAYAVFIGLHSDNTPENIKINRDKMLPYIKLAQTAIDKGDKDVFLSQLIQWNEYFEAGRVTPEHIDTLPGKLKDSMSKKIGDRFSIS